MPSCSANALAILFGYAFFHVLNAVKDAILIKIREVGCLFHDY